MTLPYSRDFFVCPVSGHFLYSIKAPQTFFTFIMYVCNYHDQDDVFSIIELFGECFVVSSFSSWCCKLPSEGLAYNDADSNCCIQTCKR